MTGTVPSPLEQLRGEPIRALSEQLGRRLGDVDRAMDIRRWAIQHFGEMLTEARSLSRSVARSTKQTVMAARNPDAPLEEITQVVDEMRKMEVLARDFVKLLQRSARRWQPLLILPPLREANKLASLLTDMEEILAGIGETYRDARWELIVERAERTRDEAGPVFEDPGALRKHLRRAAE